VKTHKDSATVRLRRMRAKGAVPLSEFILSNFAALNRKIRIIGKLISSVPIIFTAGKELIGGENEAL